MIPIEPIRWERCSLEPLLSPLPGTVAPNSVTTPDILLRQGQYFFYVGAINAGRENIIVFPFDPNEMADSHLALPTSARVALQAGPSAFDKKHVFDPAAQAIGGKVYLYYSALGNMEDSIGLATSTDSISFLKRDAPVLVGRSPEIVFHQGHFFLFYVLTSIDKGYEIHCAISEEGTKFNPQGIVLHPGDDQDWDAFEVTTPRIFQRGSEYYMIYAGSSSPDRKDLPLSFGLARSPDLLHWEKYPCNPVFEISKPGAWDDGAIWFGTVFEFNEYLYLAYEGGRNQEPVPQPPQFTQVGLAKIETQKFDTVVSQW